MIRAYSNNVHEQGVHEQCSRTPSEHEHEHVHKHGSPRGCISKPLHFDQVRSGFIINATHLLYRPGTHEYIQKYKNLYIYIGNIHILHGPWAGPWGAAGPGPLQPGPGPRAQVPARGPCKMSAFPMYMYRFLYICIYSCVPGL